MHGLTEILTKASIQMNEATSHKAGKRREQRRKPGPEQETWKQRGGNGISEESLGSETHPRRLPRACNLQPAWEGESFCAIKIIL